MNDIVPLTTGTNSKLPRRCKHANTSPRADLELMGAETKSHYRTPGPGTYDVRRASRQCLKSAPAVSFGGSLNRVDREKTGPLKVIGEKDFVPGPCSYAVEAEAQARELCERPQPLSFGRATRDDLSKLFLGNDAIAYITNRTPGPGAYELGWQRPCFHVPSLEPGTTIGGPLANVDRVQTGPLGASYKSFTPGPGAYDDESTCGIRPSLARRMRPERDGYTSALTRTRASISGSISSESETESRPARRREYEFETNHPSSPWGEKEGGTCLDFGGNSEGGALAGASAESPFSLSPFRFVDREGHGDWKLSFSGRSCGGPATMPPRRKYRSAGATRSRSPLRRTNRSRAKGDPGSKGSTSRGNATHSSSSLSLDAIHPSWRSSSSTRPATTFGTGTRAQAGQALAPGFKGYATRSTMANPGPGAYCNLPGSLGHQVDSTLHNSPTSSFSQSARQLITRDAGVPGPGAYTALSSLGFQVSSTSPTAPIPKFGTSVRCALEDGLVG